VQIAFGLCGTVALPQVVEPGRAVIALGPQFGIGNVAGNRPAIGAVALARQLHFLHQAVEDAGAALIDPIFDLHHQRSAAAGERQPHLRIGQRLIRGGVDAGGLLMFVARVGLVTGDDAGEGEGDGVGLRRGDGLGAGVLKLAFKFILKLKLPLLKLAFVLKLKFESKPRLVFRFTF